MNPVFVALTDAGFVTAKRAAKAVGGEVHASRGAFSHREKVAAPGSGRRPARGQAVQPDEGLRSQEQDLERRIPSPVALGDTLSLSERGTPAFAPDAVFIDTAQHLRSLFQSGRPIVGVCAAGILIRVLAPFISEKHREPPVLALSEDGASVVPLLGGHRGANELARRIAEAIGAHAAITTAGDNRFDVALDAPPEGWTLANPQDAKAVMAALLAGKAATIDGDAPWLAESRIPVETNSDIRLVATTRALAGDARTLVYHPRRLVVGIGCERDADPREAVELVRRTLQDAGLASASVALVASIDLKADEPAVLAVAESFGTPARFFPAASLEAETPRLKNPSDTVFREVGCHGVAEGAALASAGPKGALVVAKRKSARVTCAIAESPDLIEPGKVGRARGKLAIVGIGPGAHEWLTPEARRLLQECDAAVGYSLYLDLVTPLIAHAERFDSKLGSEEERVRRALSLAAEGRNVALVSSGDAGIYAMATLAFEVLDKDLGETFSHREKVAAEQPGEGMRLANNQPCIPSPVASGDTLSPWEREAAARRVEIVVAPGISAMQAAAARAGAPLGHDFCAISLSDLLTPWETIETRIGSAAEGDFVIAFYNPVSERRRTQLESAKQILLRHRSPDTPVVLARNLGREGESVTTIRLADLAVDAVDMLTIVIVGASTTRMVSAGGRAWTYTPRGYERKREPSPPLQWRDGEGGNPQQQLPSPLPDAPPQGGREILGSPQGGGGAR